MTKYKAWFVKCGEHALGYYLASSRGVAKAMALKDDPYAGPERFVTYRVLRCPTLDFLAGPCLQNKTIYAVDPETENYGQDAVVELATRDEMVELGLISVHNWEHCEDCGYGCNFEGDEIHRCHPVVKDEA